MIISTSVLSELLQVFPQWKTQMYFKASLTALSHAMEDQVLAGNDQPLLIASFQQERFYRQEANRYGKIGRKTPQVYVLAAPETDFANYVEEYETIAFDPQDGLAQEWHLVVIGKQYASCLICRERNLKEDNSPQGTAMDNSRRFEGIWTFDPEITHCAAHILLDRIASYRPDLKEKIATGKEQIAYLEGKKRVSLTNNPDPFVQRLIDYLQAGQFKIIKANRSLTLKEQKERLINSVTAAIRNSLDPQEILQLAVDKLGEGLGVCRCIVYLCKEKDENATINHEFIKNGVSSLQGQPWPLQNNPLFQEVIELRDGLSLENVLSDPRVIGDKKGNSLRKLVNNASISSWLLVPILYQGRLLGMVELHHCQPVPTSWNGDDIDLVNAIATQIGVALIQAEAYASLQDLNEQLAALDRTRSNLVAITGHELRTPLSTIQVCLESLSSEPDMSPELRQVMLNTALEDAERMRKLIQDFLTLSQLESGRVEWNPEPLSLEECVELALSHVRAHNRNDTLPTIKNNLATKLPLVIADGEWLVEVLSKLLDNACKFTSSEGRVAIAVHQENPRALEVTVSDTGRGIEPNRLETVFDRFYQEEGALRRSTGGTGLGLAICRQIVKGWGGKIWAESEGKNLGSQFHFTIPIFKDSSRGRFQQEAKVNRNKSVNKSSYRRRRTGK